MEDNHERTTPHEGSGAWVAPVIVALAILALAGVGMGWKGLSFAQDSRQAMKSDIQTMRDSEARDLDTVQQRLSQAEKTNGELQDDVSVITKRLRITQGELKKARAEAQQIREDSAKQLEAMNTEVKGELENKADTAQVTAVSGEVTGVRTDLDSTKKDLQMARSELGTLIARNHDDIETLRRIGERDYVEFTVAQRNRPEKVGPVTVELRSANPKRNQFNLALTVEDKQTEKKNRTINEPIFFYTHGAKQPMELVVNQVQKNKIVGYLSIPKSNPQPSSGGGSY